MRYNCEVCEYSGNGKTQYDRHIKTGKHMKRCKLAEECEIECDRCSACFLTESQLEKHKESNSVFYDNPALAHRECNDFVCNLCDLSFNFSKALVNHQSHCDGKSKFTSYMKPETLEKKRIELEKIKLHNLETGCANESLDRLTFFIKTGIYPDDDYYHKSYLDTDLEKEEADPESMFYIKIIKKETVYYKNKEYKTDGLNNAFDEYGKFIGLFVD